MVQEQLARRGVRREPVLNAFRKVPRHLFVPPPLQRDAYADHPLEIGSGQTISQPYIVALMVDCLRLGGTEKVLEVGTGSGYQTAVLAELATSVCTVERIPSLAEAARQRLDFLGYRTIAFRTGDGSLGWSEEAPFEGIVVSCAAKEVPPALLSQLKEGGSLVMPLGGALRQMLTVLQKVEGNVLAHPVCPCVFVPLVAGRS